MTYGQAFVALAIAAASAVGVLIAAHARWQRRGLVAGAAALALASGAFFLSRAATAGHRARGPWTLGSAVVVSLVPVAVAAAIVYLRRGRGSRLLTGALAWIGLLVAYFESAYLLRP
jgi:hypothetical protein